jgi:ankyrin repeat protein
MGDEKMMLKRLIIVGILAISLMISGCGRSPEDARKDLSKMNIQYSEQSFVKVAENNDMTAVKLFLEAGMSPNTSTEDGTPLIVAAGKGNLEMVKLLVEKGANVNTKGKDEITPIMAAILGEGKETVKKEVIKFLLDKGVDLNVRFIVDGVGVTPLMMAVEQKDIEIVKLILSQKVNVNAADVNTGFTALMLAVTNDNTEIVKELLSKGADVNRKAKNNVTALAIAQSNNNAEMINVLKNAGAK